MKIGIISKPNTKGQIVIPKVMREALGIDANRQVNIVMRGDGIYIYPIAQIVAKGENVSSYSKLLEKTQGAWAGDDWDAMEAKRRKIELRASKRMRRSW